MGTDLLRSRTTCSIACFGLLSAFLVLAMAGCDSTPAKKSKSGFSLKSHSETAESTQQADHLDRVINQIKNVDVTDWSVFESKMTLGLNNAWSSAKKAKNQSMDQAVKSWTPSKALETLPEVYQDNLWVKNFDQDTYLYTDAYYLQEQYWLHQILQQTKDRSQVGRFAFLTDAGLPAAVSLPQALRQRDSRLDEKSAEQLALALQLFDWSLRNVTGDAFIQFQEDEWESERLQPLVAGMPPSFSGVRGPGYTNYLWQTLCYGRGDVWQQAHTFLQLARHAQIQACVLGLPNATPSRLFPRVAHPEITPWAIAVSLDSGVYLFEPRMGLPMLHPDSKAVLTLSDVKSQPELLSSFSLTPAESTSPDAVYPVTGSDLQPIVALLDYPLESFALRTQFIHENLVGESRLPVYFPVDPALQHWKSLPEIDDAQLWALPLEINIFRGVVREADLRASRDNFVSLRLQWATLAERYFDEFPLLRESRVLFLQGQFTPDPTGLKRDALQELQEMRYSNEEISNIATDRDLQQILGLSQENQSAEDFSKRIRVMQARMRLVRADVQMFLAMAHQELRNFSTALNWLGLVKEFDTQEKWYRHTLYLQGRNQEAMHHYDKAIEYYLTAEKQLASERSPRDFGNVLRARWIQQQLQTSSAAPADTSKSPEGEKPDEGTPDNNDAGNL